MPSTIQDALSTSESSLHLIGQQMNLISNNIANASTPGYTQEDLQGADNVTNGIVNGVLADPVQRMSNAAAAATANEANGSAAYSKEMVNVLTPYTNTLGQASDASSLPSVISNFATALTTLSSAPSDAATQDSAVTAAQNVAGTLNSLDTAVSTARETADQNIASSVSTVNSDLTQLAQNETNLQLAAANGQSTAPYEDTRDQLVASISQVIPVNVLPNGSNGVALTTTGGTVLYDNGVASQLSFTATPNITSSTPAVGQTGGLSAVTINGQTLPTSQSGSLSADLQLRDVTLPGYSNQLDQIAGNLISSFQTADPTVNDSTPEGLFTNDGSALASGGSITGLAGSISVNSAVVSDPALIQAGANGTPSNSTVNNTSTILSYIGALQTTQGSYTASSGLPASATVGTAASAMAGLQQSNMTTWTSVNTTRTAQASSATTTLTADTGVSVDDQLQRLMIVQQTYAASAQVIQAASNMLNSLIQVT